MLRRVLLTVLVAGLPLYASSCVPQAVTEQGRATKGLYDTFTIIAAVIFILVAVLIGSSIVRFRRKQGDDTLPDQFHTNTKLEILWFAIPQMIVIGLFIGSVVVLHDVEKVGADDAVTIEVTSFQWGWRFTYEGSDVTLESLPRSPATIAVPVGTTVAFELRSDDVIHSFYVPEFLVKRDVVPGRTNHLEVMVEEPGTYTGRCAEFCGLLHDRMDFTIEALDPAEFDSWLAAGGGS